MTTISSLSARVVEREQVLDPPLDHGLLVVGGDDHRTTARRASVRATGRGRSARRQRDDRGVGDVRPDERAERAPEHRLRNGTRASVVIT